MRSGEFTPPENHDDYKVFSGYRWWDSNPHDPLGQRILSPLRLPFRHIGLSDYQILTT